MPPVRALLLAPILAVATACGGGIPTPNSCQLASIGQGPDPATGEAVYRYSVECDVATFRSVCEPLDAQQSRWKVSCGFGTFDNTLTLAGGEVTSSFEADSCPMSLGPFNEACGYEAVPRSQ